MRHIGKEWAVEKAAELSRDLCRLHQVGNDRWQITASIGVAVLQGADFEMFYKNGDAALYESKKNGRNRYTVYCKEAE
ncbi:MULTISPECIES: diguanylate cyclase domain-containing protein [Clostridia]|uniref:diguanylate cyclase domain-containing protein n=1 Tax=Clostridia TaxID=186801 RepID=UPI00067E7A5A|nr:MULTISPECIES: diguanylate cyclase [Clostridia]